jgi:hypothetical protein
MSTIYILFALFTYGESNSSFDKEFNSQGACIMAMNEGVSKRIFTRAMCVPKG